MLIWLVIGGLLTHDKVVIGSRVARGSQQLQCPQVPASFGEYPLDLSSFSAFLNQSDGVGDDSNSSDGGQCKFIQCYLLAIGILLLFMTTIHYLTIHIQEVIRSVNYLSYLPIIYVASTLLVLG